MSDLSLMQPYKFCGEMSSEPAGRPSHSGIGTVLSSRTSSLANFCYSLCPASHSSAVFAWSETLSESFAESLVQYPVSSEPEALLAVIFNHIFP